MNCFHTNKCEDDVEIVKKIRQEVKNCCKYQNTAEKILKAERVAKNIKVRYFYTLLKHIVTLKQINLKKNINRKCILFHITNILEDFNFYLVLVIQTTLKK